jgi:hypothetical protein
MKTIKLSDRELKAALVRFVMDNYGVRLNPSKVVIEITPHLCVNGLPVKITSESVF